MANHRRTTESLPLRTVPAHVRAAAGVRRPVSNETTDASRVRRGLVLVALVAFAIAFGVAARWVIYGDALRIREVHVNTLQVVDPLAVSAAAAVTGKTLLTVDRGAVALAVAKVPGVKSVEVRREWPHAIGITIVEHQGWGYWDVNGRRMVVDENGVTLESGRGPSSQALVIYEDTTSPEAAATAIPDPEAVHLVQRFLDEGTFSILRVTPTGFSYRRDRGLTVHVATGPAAVFGDAHDFDFKVATWGALLDKIEAQHLPVTEIDLRFGKHVVMR
ncbi:MAG: FtsQ-type POTRA domain-containing protein [Dehalococcoidia bacterium]